MPWKLGIQQLKWQLIIAKKACVKKLLLTHISTRYKETKTLAKEALDIFEDSCIADDMMVFEVKQNEP